MFAKHGLASMISPFVDRAPVPVYKDNRQVGRATSIAWGTTIKKMVGFGSLDKALEKPGSRVSVEYSVEGERGKVAATVVPAAVPGPAPQAHLTSQERHDHAANRPDGLRR